MSNHSRWYEKGDGPLSPRNIIAPAKPPAKKRRRAIIQLPILGRSNSPVLREIILRELQRNPKARKSQLASVLADKGYVDICETTIATICEALKHRLSAR
jgi:hypothetical protein